MPDEQAKKPQEGRFQRGCTVMDCYACVHYEVCKFQDKVNAALEQTGLMGKPGVHEDDVEFKLGWVPDQCKHFLKKK